MMNLTCVPQPAFAQPALFATDLALASMVQRQLLPRKGKALPGIRYAAASVPAGHIGGDYYDFLDLGPGYFGFLLADVCGKGIAAGLLMANLQASIRSECARGAGDLGAMFERVNARFFESTLPEQYATMFFGEYDERTRQIRYVNCGHPPALVVSRTGSVRKLGATAMPLGVFPDWEAEQQTFYLQQGDTLCVYSDGVIEAGVDAGCEFGERRLNALLQENKERNVGSVVKAIVDAVLAHAPGPDVDDLTVLGIRCI